MNKETKIMRDIINYLKDRKIWTLRVNADSSTVGIPDIIACYRGRLVGLEVKTDTGKPTEIQKRTIDEIVKNGGFGGFPTSIADVEFILRKVDAEYNWQR